jgi:hypothetical protein
MRRITITAAAAAIALGGLLGGAGVASAEPDVTAEQCEDGGGYVQTFFTDPGYDENGNWSPGGIYRECWGGKYDGHSVRW